MAGSWKKLTAEMAGEIIDVEELDADALDLLKPGMRTEEYIGALSSAGKFTEAAMMMARALPKREAVWWACVCASKTQVLSKNKEEALALKVAEKWAFKPTEENRVEAFLQAQKSNTPSIGTMSCMAVAFTGGKLELSEGQSVDLDESAFSKIVSGVVMISAGDQGADQFNGLLERFLEQGRDIACGGRGQASA